MESTASTSRSSRPGRFQLIRFEDYRFAFRSVSAGPSPFFQNPDFPARLHGDGRGADAGPDSSVQADVLVAEIEGILRYPLTDQEAFPDQATGILGPDDPSILMVKEEGFGSHLPIVRVGKGTKGFSIQTLGFHVHTAFRKLYPSAGLRMGCQRVKSPFFPGFGQR